MTTQPPVFSSLRNARSGKDYAKLLYEALAAAGVPKGNVLKIIQDAEKNSGIRPTKTMRSELSELTLPNIMTLPDELFKMQPSLALKLIFI